MAARFKTRNYTLLSGAAVSLATILNSPNDSYISTIAVRTPRSNAGTIYWRDAAAGENGGHLGPDEAVTLDLVSKYISTSDLWFIGTTSDVIEITVIG